MFFGRVRKLVGAIWASQSPKDGSSSSENAPMLLGESSFRTCKMHSASFENRRSYSQDTRTHRALGASLSVRGAVARRRQAFRVVCASLRARRAVRFKCLRYGSVATLLQRSHYMWLAARHTSGVRCMSVKYLIASFSSRTAARRTSSVR